ncbi:MAG: hypothetical protein RLZZ507_3457 [Cyanobacteriota bacterium]|jgi:antitoxin ParD1/3/4
MKVRGIKRGQNIEIIEQINNIPDGTEIIVDLNFIEKQISAPQLSLTEEEKLAKLNKLFGVWENQPDLTEIFTEIDQQRHAYQGINIDPIDQEEYE